MTLLATGSVDKWSGIIYVIIEILGFLGLSPWVSKLWAKIKSHFVTIDKIVQDAIQNTNLSKEEKVVFAKVMCRQHKINYQTNEIEKKLAEYEEC